MFKVLLLATIFVFLMLLLALGDVLLVNIQLGTSSETQKGKGN